MDPDYTMNKLFSLKNMGFKISWNLIDVGLYGNGEVPPLLIRDELIEYLKSLLMSVDEQTDDIVALICEEDDSVNFNRILKKFADQEETDVAIQKRKWKAFLLKNLLDDISCDYLQGLLELMEFWVSMGEMNGCPQDFPSKNDPMSVKDYFTQESYEFNVKINRLWLEKEIAAIVELEANN